MTLFEPESPGLDLLMQAVLRANQGAVDATIDQLLTMTTDNENEKLRNEIEEKETLVVGPTETKTRPQDPSPVRSPQKLPQTEAVSSSGVIEGELPLKTIRGWAPPLLGPLPDDFLRISPDSRHTNRLVARLQMRGRYVSACWHQSYARRRWLRRERQRRKAEQAMLLSQQLLQQKYVENKRVRGVLCDVGDPELDRYLEDERIALFLQNEEFMAELRWNKDFLCMLEKDQAGESPPEEDMCVFPLSKTLSASHDEDALFKERLRNMGKMSRKKFAQLARVFTRRKKRSSAKSILGHGAAPSNESLLLNVEPEHLLEEEEDQEEEIHNSHYSVVANRRD
uniref:CUE domain-containing protein n=1 Tax=Timema cristinae TaxID=61476 RepID=A0A7R9CH93_TIMCR|nr:unnamed protein product [Timema cristinae]